MMWRHEQEPSDIKYVTSTSEHAYRLIAVFAGGRIGHGCLLDKGQKRVVGLSVFPM